jgi:hypothetical protein
VFEFDPNAVFKAGAAMLAAGGRVIRLEGITEDGYCTCGNPAHHIKGSGAKQCGKHPSGGASWQHRAAKTEDDILAWVEDYESTGKPFNIGLQLGPVSGIIDIEWDDEEAKRYAEQIGITRIDTPTYQSGRSEHRLFRWDDRLEVVEKAVVYPGGLEVRLGVGKKATQSVIPCSWHYSGRQYVWKPTKGIDEVEIAPLPEVLVKAVCCGGATGNGNRGKAKSSRWVIHGEVGEGHRHPSLLALCTKLVMRNEFYQSQDEQADIMGLVWNTNLQNCKPPKSREEVATILHSCVEYRRSLEERGEMLPKKQEEIEAAAEKIAEVGEESQKAPVSGYALQGLAWRPVENWREGEWLPGDWKIQMVESDPPEIILINPHWDDTPCRGRITFAFDEFRSSVKVANKVFQSTRRVVLDGDRGEWERAWRGVEGNATRPKVAGLVEKLVQKMNEDDSIKVGAASLRYATLCAYLMEAISKATTPRNEEAPEPNTSGRPCWVKPDELWFKWQKTWEDIGRQHDVQAGERIRIKHLLCQTVGADDLPEGRHTFGTVRHAFVVFTPAWVAAVQKLAEGAPKSPDETAADEPTQNPLNTGVPNGSDPTFSVLKVRTSRLETEVV